jgi:hypothetical protein
MMNYVTIPHNLQYVNPIATPSFNIIPSLKENKSFTDLLVLNTISQALRTSLKNYEVLLANLMTTTPKSQERSILNT